MIYKEEWAVDITRLERFFLSFENAVLMDNGIINCENCIVRLEALPPRPFGPLKLPRTRLEISGGAESASRLYRAFFIHFISAGG